MNKHWRYLKYLLRHKLYVFQYGWQLGIPWLGLLHDNSKFSPAEWSGYVESFYGDRSAPGVKERFNAAWLHHQNNNKHHWQYWMLINNEQPATLLPMPDRYRREMLADWKGAGKAITGVEDALGWYAKNRLKMSLHPLTRGWIEDQLGYVDL